ncbi:hypothetical protein BH11ACT3_BH11ACT3_25720 [soil metagenome]
MTAEVDTDEITQAMQVGFGRLWLTSAENEGEGPATVIGVALANPTDVVRIPLGSTYVPPESSVAVTDESVWVLGVTDQNVLVEIDPSTSSIVRTIPAPPNSGPLRGGFGSLWVSLPGEGTVQRLDPADGSVIATINVGPRPTFMFSGPDAMWVMNAGDGTVSRLDPADNTAQTVPASTGSIDGGDIAAGDGVVWVRTSAELAVLIDPDTLKVVRRLGPSSGSGSIAIDGDGVWISAHDITTVWFVTPR